MAEQLEFDAEVERTVIERYRPGRRRANVRRYKATEKGKRTERVAHVERRYGLASGRYDQMLRDQSGVCAICGEPETEKHKGAVKPLSVDHDHDTNQVRGLLCTKCNRGISMFRDNPFLMEAAAEYLRKGAVV